MQEIVLPHKAPLKFAKYLLLREDKYAEISLEFPTVPTLGMMLEGAAQSSASFAKKSQKIGLVVNFKNIELYTDASTKEMKAIVIQNFSNEESSLISFEVKEFEKTLVKGEILIMLQDAESTEVQI